MNAQTTIYMLNEQSNTARQSSRRQRARRHWWAWMALCAAVAGHVLDEALTGFLDIYNSAVLAMHERQPFLPVPTFTFEGLLTLLIVVLVLLVAASFFVWQGRWAMRPISYLFAGLMLLNGLMHIASSLLMWKLMPGVYSSPLLLAASIALIVYTRAHSRKQFRNTPKAFANVSPGLERSDNPGTQM